MATAIEYGLIAALATVVVVTGVTASGVDVGLSKKPPYVAVSFPERPKEREFVGWKCPAGTVLLRSERANNPYACVAGVAAVPIWK